ncbi:putative BTB/POZ domain containing protein [Blattamonas nauphoetae]|uniref:BTB/POZ domain containing protein n=1 Tax=Blattamonas nauphoetae TaxID=2049346 RepID=A0ABQ9XG54_9EUKA|nr:putative BTB/POZ domain containing protein [Blattamonas nauphoetae]
MNEEALYNEEVNSFKREKTQFDQSVRDALLKQHTLQEQCAIKREEILKEKVKILAIRKEFEAKTKESQIVNSIIELNVGGQIFPTLVTTLTHHQQSRLARIVTGSEIVPRDPEGRFFLDRTPAVFEKVLDYLRTDQLPSYFDSEEEERIFHQEMTFYELGFSASHFQPVWNTRFVPDGVQITDNDKIVTVNGKTQDHIVLIGHEKVKSGTATVLIQVHIPRPNRYALGVLLDVPDNLNRGFAYKNGVIGWGLHDHVTNLGIYYQTQFVAPSTLGYSTNDIVTMIVDVDRGNLTYKVNGVKCAELLGCDMFKQGVWLAASLYNEDAKWRIIN